MSAVLVVTFRAPYPRHDGSALRVYHLTRELAQDRPCHLATFGPREDGEPQLLENGVFQTITRLPQVAGRPAFRRHFRLSNEAYWRHSHPATFQAVTARLQALIKDLDIAAVIATDLWLAEFVAELQGVQRIVDDCDCLWLTLQRQMRVESMPPKQWLMTWVHRVRARRVEGRLTSRVEMVTTVSPVDRLALQQLSKTRREAIHLVPAGVAPALVEWDRQVTEIPNTVAFWGNLDFPPNREAVWHFYRDVFRPYLRGTGITVYLIGPNPSAELVAATRHEPQIRVTGFVDDLFNLVARVPVVINPMVIGTGIKTKMLEAFALRRAVVSTTLGMEGITAVAGEHYVAADDPGTFAQAIRSLLSSPEERIRLGGQARELVLQRYTWKTIGAEWRRLIDSIVAERRNGL